MRYLFKNGVEKLFEGDIEQALKEGWSEDRELVVVPQTEGKDFEALSQTIIDQQKEIESKNDEIFSLKMEIEALKADTLKEDNDTKTDDLDSMSNEDLRELGKKLKIKSYHLLKIDTLKDKIREER